MNHVLYATSNSVDFAQLIATHLETELFQVEKENFADGEINVKFNESIRGKSLIIVAQIEMPYENLFELLLTCDAARRCAAKEIVLVIPYLPHSRQERRGNNRSPISARLVADLLQNAGANRIISMDLHLPAIEGFYSISFDKLYPTEVFVEKIRLLNIENMILCSPDFGFMKKMEVYQEILQCPMCVIDKKREVANQIKEMVLIGDVRGKNVVIIDDIIDTAGTLVKASDLLLVSGALSVTVFATHGVMSYKSEFDNAMYRLIRSKIKTAYISNTLGYFDENDFSGTNTNKVKPIDVSGIFARAIEKIQSE